METKNYVYGQNKASLQSPAELQVILLERLRSISAVCNVCRDNAIYVLKLELRGATRESCLCIFMHVYNTCIKLGSQASILKRKLVAVQESSLLLR